jgi:MoaA/NifB/PqqE/SkfB family radical SAM enzyme
MMKKILKKFIPLISKISPGFLSKAYKYRTVYYEKYSQKKLPVELQIEITTKCSAKCVMCGHNDLKKICFPVKDMDIKIIDRIKDVISSYYNDRTINISLFGVGEPLLCSNLYEIANTLQMPNASHIIYTTGFNMTQSIAKELLKDKSFRLIRFSLNKKDRNSYRELMGVDKFNESINGIKIFLEERNKSGKSVHVQIKFFEDSKEFSLPEVDKFIKKYGDISIKYTPYSEVLYNEQKNISFTKNYKFYRYPCAELMPRFLYIDVEGGLYKCCQSLQNAARGETNDLYMGNIFSLDLDIKQEWKTATDEFENQINGEYGKFIKSCKNCVDHSVHRKLN